MRRATPNTGWVKDTERILAASLTSMARHWLCAQRPRRVLRRHQLLGHVSGFKLIRLVQAEVVTWEGLILMEVDFRQIDDRYGQVLLGVVNYPVSLMGVMHCALCDRGPGKCRLPVRMFQSIYHRLSCVMCSRGNMHTYSEKQYVCRRFEKQQVNTFLSA